MQIWGEKLRYLRFARVCAPKLLLSLQENEKVRGLGSEGVKKEREGVTVNNDAL